MPYDGVFWSSMDSRNIAMYSLKNLTGKLSRPRGRVFGDLSYSPLPKERQRFSAMVRKEKMSGCEENGLEILRPICPKSGCPLMGDPFSLISAII